MSKLYLSDAELNKIYRVKTIDEVDEEFQFQLKNIGLKQNEKIKVLHTNFKRKSFIVKIMGVNFAIDRKICEKVEIEDA